MSIKAITLATCVALLCVTSIARGQTEISEPNALGLGWTGCSTANPVGAASISFACENDVIPCRVFRLMPTFISTITDPEFAGSVVVIDVLIGSSPTVGQWWSGLVPGGCRDAAFSVPIWITAASLPTAGACHNVYPSPASTLPEHHSSPSGVLPNRYRISASNSVHPTQPLTTGERTYAMQLEFRTEGTLADCDPAIDPTPICTDGCNSGACFVLNRASIYLLNGDGIHYTHDGGATRNWCTYQGGTGANCPGATPTKSSTWGAVKALYR